LFVGGAAAAVIVFGAVLIPFLISSNHAKTVPPAPVSQPSTPETPPPTVPPPAQLPVQPTPTPKASIDKTPHPSGVKQPKVDDTGVVSPVVPPRGSAKCELIPSEIPKTLDRAEYLLHAGQLEEAQAAFESVQWCPGAYQRAQAGLKLVKQRMVTQGLTQ
jgi:hypothetical protein